MSRDPVKYTTKTFSSYIDWINALTYRETPVDILTFLREDDYLGLTTDNSNKIYPGWLSILEDIFRNDSQYLVVLTGSIGIGKSTIAIYCMAYIIYRILCLKSPHDYFSLAGHDPFAVSFFNLTKSLGDSRGFNKLQNCLMHSPWFKRNGIIRGKENQHIDFPLFIWKLSSPYCFTADTKISLLDSRELSITEVIEQVRSGNEVWVYSYDISTDRIVPGKVINGGKTGNRAEILKITLDSGESIKCTPSHKFLLRNGEYREAQLLKPNDSIMPLYRKKSKKGYEWFFEQKTNKWKCTHRRAAGPIPKKYIGKGGRYKTSFVVHHKDFNKLNNRPTNLQYMSAKQHALFHSKHWKNTWGKYAISDENRRRASAHFIRLNRDPSFILRNTLKWTKKRRKEQAKRMADMNRSLIPQKNCDKVKASENMRIARNRFLNSKEAVQYRIQRSKSQSRLMRNGLAKKMSILGNSKEARKKAIETRKNNLNNHKILSVEFCGYEDVYDIEVEKYHNFALSAGVFVHNSKGFGVIGEDLITGVLDEVNDPMAALGQKHRILKAYEETFHRFQSRFVKDQESLSRLFLVSSKSDDLAFLEMFIEEMKGSERVLVIDKAEWEIKPKSMYSGRRFSVLVGDAYTQSKILTEEEKIQYVKDGKNVVDIPIELKFDFERDIISSLRDYAGIAVRGIRRYKLFPSERFITDCFDKEKFDPFGVETIEIGLHDEVELITLIDFSKFRTSLNVPRCIHMDTAFTEDCLGLSMSGVSGWAEKNIQKEDGTFITEVVPIIETDFCIRFKAKPEDRIPLFKIRKFILDLKSHGVIIQMFSADLRLASEDTTQILTKAGIDCEYFSLDKTITPYIEFRNLVFEKRWCSHYHTILYFELKELEHDRERNKIDHPDKIKVDEVLDDGQIRRLIIAGSKDISDAVVGAVSQSVKYAKKPLNVDEIIRAIRERKQKDKVIGLPSDWFIKKSSDTKENSILVRENERVNKMIDSLKSFKRRKGIL